MANKRNPEKWVACPSGHRKHVEDPHALYFMCGQCGIRWPNPDPAAIRQPKPPKQPPLSQTPAREPSTRVKSRPPAPTDIPLKTKNPPIQKPAEPEYEPWVRRWMK